MHKDTKKIAVIKEAIDGRLKELYKDQNQEVSPEARTLEYLMCLVEADIDSPDYARSCLIKMYE